MTKCTKCGGATKPQTNGNGGVVDSCARCDGNSLTGVGRVTVVTKIGQQCTIKDCPGTLDAQGVCRACEKRAAWLAANTPKRACEICEGPISGRGGRKYCGACKGFAQLAKIAKHHEKQRTGKKAA